MKSTMFRRTFAAAAAAAVLGTGLAASSPALAQAVPALITVNAGFVPVTDVAALYLGEEVGIFKKHGLQLKANVASTGSVPRS